MNIATGGVFSGWGTLRYQDALAGVDTTQLSNDGTLRAARDGVAPDSERFTLLIESSDPNNNAFVDLDGASNSGMVNIDYNTTLDIDVQLRDFWATMNFEGGSILDLANDELVRGTAIFNIDAASAMAGVPSTATIRGGNINAIGSAQFNVLSGTLQFASRLDTAAAPAINLSDDTGLTFNGGATIDGNLNMDADDLTLTINSAVIINDNTWNWDGISGNASTTIVNSGAVLTINSDSIETSLDGQMDGAIELNGGTLRANIAGGWTFGGQLTVDSTHATSVVTGSTLLVADGVLSVGGGAFTTQVDTSVTFSSDATTVAGGVLELGNSEAGHNILFQGGSSHVGTGTLAFGGDIAVLGSTIIDMVSGTVDFDRGGNDLSQTMDLSADLVVTAGTMGVVGDTSGIGQFTLNIHGSTTRLTVDVTGGANAWTLGPNGTINITAAGTLDTSIGGDTLLVQGNVNVDGDTRFTAPVEVATGGVIDLPLATSSLQLAGGTNAAPNTLAGGIIDGNGTLTATGTTALEGHGTINTDVQFFNSADLKAAGGTLAINGELLDADVVGASAGGTLQLAQTLDTANVTVLDITGGIVSGVGVVNSGITRGYGIVNVSNFKNNGLVFGRDDGTGQALSVGATGGVDLDGDGLAGDVEATSGDVKIISPLTDDFGGTATVGFGRTLEFQSGWTLGTNGVLDLNGAFQNCAVVASTAAVLRGTVHVDGYGRFTGQTTFRSDADVSIPNTTDRLEVTGTTMVEAGATFTGTGAFSNLNTAQLTLNDGVELDVPLLNNGQLVLGGEARVTTFDQVSTGDLLIDIGGTGIKDYDHLLFDNTASIAGDLIVTLTGGFMPLAGDEFDLLTGNGGVSGTFATTPEELPALGGGLGWEIDYNGAEVVLRVVSDGLPGDFNGDGTVNLADYTVWRDNLGAATEAALSGNGNNSAGVDAGDYPLWKTGFASGSASGSATTVAAENVPEPMSYVLLLAAATMLLTVRRP